MNTSCFELEDDDDAILSEVSSPKLLFPEDEPRFSIILLLFGDRSRVTKLIQKPLQNAKRKKKEEQRCGEATFGNSVEGIRGCVVEQIEKLNQEKEKTANC